MAGTDLDARALAFLRTIGAPAQRAVIDRDKLFCLVDGVQRCYRYDADTDTWERRQ